MGQRGHLFPIIKVEVCVGTVFLCTGKTILLVEAKAYTKSGGVLFLASLAAFGSLAYFAYNKIDRQKRDRFLNDLQFRGRRAMQNFFPHSVDEYIAVMEYDRQTL